MPKQTLEYLCLLISPNDVLEERDALTTLINNWNAQVGHGLKVRVEPIRWESHMTPDLSDTAQNLINKQFVEDCDFGIAVFWSRLGTPTAEHDSGSVEEIYKLIQRGARVLVYFCDRPIPQKALEDEQFAKLKEVREKLEDQGLVAAYSEVSDLREQVQLHLTSIVTQMAAKDLNLSPFIPSSGTITAPTPDVRVIVRVGVAVLPLQGEKIFLSVFVENHSPISVFTGNVYIETKTGEQVFFRRDFLTHQLQQRRELRSGEKFTFNIDFNELRKFSHLGLVCAAVSDDISRVYRSTETELKKTIEALAKE